MKCMVLKYYYIHLFLQLKFYNEINSINITIGLIFN